MHNWERRLDLYALAGPDLEPMSEPVAYIDWEGFVRTLDGQMVPYDWEERQRTGIGAPLPREMFADVPVPMKAGGGFDVLPFHRGRSGWSPV